MASPFAPVVSSFNTVRGRKLPVPYSTIQAEFERIRDFVIKDLRILIENEVGGNYIAISLITCACDALARFNYGQKNRGDLFFTQRMLSPEWRPVGKSIYDAVRNGIVHSYDTKAISLNGRRLTLGISWEKDHLSFSADKTCLYINVQVLAENLKQALNEFEQELICNSSAREEFYKAMSKDRVQDVKDREELKKWARILSE